MGVNGGGVVSRVNSSHTYSTVSVIPRMDKSHVRMQNDKA